MSIIRLTPPTYLILFVTSACGIAYVHESSADETEAVAASEVIALDGPNLALEPGSGATDGTFSAIIDQMDVFACGDIGVASLHYMSTDLSVGGVAYGGTQPAFDLQAGDFVVRLATVNPAADPDQQEHDAVEQDSQQDHRKCRSLCRILHR